MKTGSHRAIMIKLNLIALLATTQLANADTFYVKFDPGISSVSIDKEKLNLPEESVDEQSNGFMSKIGLGYNINSNISIETGIYEGHKNIKKSVTKKSYSASGNYLSAYLYHTANNSVKYYFMVGKFNWESYIKPSINFDPVTTDGSNTFYGLGVTTSQANFISYSFNLDYFPLNNITVKRLSIGFLINFDLY